MSVKVGILIVRAGPLIAAGFGEAATVVDNAAHCLDPDRPVFPCHSTDVPALAVA